MAECTKELYGTEFIFAYRDDSQGDNGVIGQVLDGLCFDIERWHQGRVAMAYYVDLIKNKKTPLIMDAGANIGASSIYFSSLFKESRIISIEPERNNVELLKKNVSQLKDCKVIDGALGAVPGTMFLQDPGLSDWGFRVGDKGDYSVQVTTVNQVLDTNCDCIPFLAKIDIEGGELSLFDNDTDWFLRFAVVIFETHDWMLPYKGVSNGLIRAAAQGDFDMLFHGENLFFFNHKWLLNHHNPF